MATKKKATKRPEVRIRITGPQGTGKTRLAEAIAALTGGVVDGWSISGKPLVLRKYVESLNDIGGNETRTDELLRALLLLSESSIVITTSNE